MSEKMLNVEIDEELRQELKEYAKKNGLVVKVLISKLIRSFLDSQKGSEDVRKDSSS